MTGKLKKMHFQKSISWKFRKKSYFPHLLKHIVIHVFFAYYSSSPFSGSTKFSLFFFFFSILCNILIFYFLREIIYKILGEGNCLSLSTIHIIFLKKSNLYKNTHVTPFVTIITHNKNIL